MLLLENARAHGGLMAYPILGGIPCLWVESGILASKYPEYRA